MHAQEPKPSRAQRALRLLTASSAATAATPSTSLSRRLTAASSPATPAGGTAGVDLLRPEAIKARKEKWQARVLELAELVPEATGAGNFVNGTLSRVKLVVKSADGTDAPDTPEAVELQRRMDKFDLGRMGELMFFAGEAWIAWPEVGDADVLSIDEIRTNTDPMEVKGADGSWEPMLSTTRVIRVWRPSKRNRYHATSPHKSLLDLLESMYIHQLGDMAVAHSRMISAGILVWPTSRKREGLDEDGNIQPGSQEELVDQFRSTATQALNSSSGLEAKIPFLFLVDNTIDAANAVPQLVKLERDDYAGEYDTRFSKYAERYGSAVDLPVEQTTGMGSAKGWTAKQIDEQTWTAYLAPRVKEIVDAINERVAAQYGLMIAADARAIIAKPDPTEIVMQLLALGVVTPESAKATLISGDIDDLVMREPVKTAANPEVNARSASAVTDAPSSFQPNGDRGGGAYRENGK